MIRFNLVYRRLSGSGRGLPTNCVAIILAFLFAARQFILEHKLGLDQIFNFDETSFYEDAPGSTTILKKGVKKSYGKSTGNEKTRLMSFLMTAAASGEKLPLLCVIPRVKRLNEIEKENILYAIFDKSG